MKKIIMAAALLCMGIFGMQAQTLKFNSNKKFRIVQFTDIHWVTSGHFKLNIVL